MFQIVSKEELNENCISALNASKLLSSSLIVTIKNVDDSSVLL